VVCMGAGVIMVAGVSMVLVYVVRRCGVKYPCCHTQGGQEQQQAVCGAQTKGAQAAPVSRPLPAISPEATTDAV
jgi:hypothetical protein